MSRKAIFPVFDSVRNDIDLTPMLDVIFIMLVFFIVTSSFERETGVEAQSVDAEAVSDSEAEAILVRIDDADLIRIDGLDVDSRAVRANIERLHAVNPEFPVVIQPARWSTTKTLVAVLDAARAARIENIAIAPATP